jgi:hypothetical protein
MTWCESSGLRVGREHHACGNQRAVCGRYLAGDDRFWRQRPGWSRTGIRAAQLVIDGRLERVGSDARAVERAVEQAATSPKAAVSVAALRSDELHLGVDVHVRRPSSLSIGEALDAVVAVAEDNLSTQVRRGENGGRILKHSGVVRSLTTIGTLSPRDSEWSMNGSVPWDRTWKPAEVRVIAFLQQRESRQIVGAGSASLDPRAGAK